MRRLPARLAALVAGGLLVQGAAAQQVKIERFPKGSNTANPSQYTISRSPIISRTPRVFDYYYFTGRNNLYALSPFVLAPQPAVPRVIGPSIPYTDEEYGLLLLSTEELGAVAPVGSRRELGTLVQPVPDAIPARYETVETRIIDVGDRGNLVAETQETVRLRGVRMPSERVTDDVTRYYAREAIRVLRELVSTQPVTVLFEEPLRGADGTLLATLYLPDGTSLNRLMLEYGYGQFAPDDFLPGEVPVELAAAEESARTIKIGLWSRRQ